MHNREGCCSKLGSRNRHGNGHALGFLGPSVQRKQANLMEEIVNCDVTDKERPHLVDERAAMACAAFVKRDNLSSRLSHLSEHPSACPLLLKTGGVTAGSAPCRTKILESFFRPIDDRILLPSCNEISKSANGGKAEK